MPLDFEVQPLMHTRYEPVRLKVFPARRPTESSPEWQPRLSTELSGEADTFGAIYPDALCLRMLGNCIAFLNVAWLAA